MPIRIASLRFRPVLLTAAVALLTVAAALPGAASGRHVRRDRVIRGRWREASAADSNGRYYATGDGDPVYIERDPGYSVDSAQRVAHLLGGFVHGSELNSLKVLLAGSQHLRNLCGGGVASCYYPSHDRIVTNGRDPYVLAHEYGHHVARHRSDFPWYAENYGTKRWSTYEQICDGVRHHRYYPGNQFAHYYDDPGESFAESFAILNYPSRPYGWGFNSALDPDATALRKIKRDVLDPWRNDRPPVQWSAALGDSQPAATTSVGIPLDGRVSVSLEGPDGAEYDLALLAPGGDELARSNQAGADDTVRYNACSVRRARVRVLRESGSGPFTAQIRVP